MTYSIVPRTAIGLPAIPRNVNGTVRPLLHNEPFITAHYTGNNVTYKDKVTPEVVRQIQAVFSSMKPFEYNYVIGQEPNDAIYEFAGKHQAAHSAGENHIAFGVLFLLGIGEAPTFTMIDKWRWLRDVLIFDGSLAPNVIQMMHFQMPDAGTACPGQIRNYWPLFLPPWTPGDDDMAVSAYVMRPPTARQGQPWIVVEGGSARPATSKDLPQPQGDGKYPVWQPTDEWAVGQYDQMLAYIHFKAPK